MAKWINGESAFNGRTADTATTSRRDKHYFYKLDPNIPLKHAGYPYLLALSAYFAPCQSMASFWGQWDEKGQIWQPLATAFQKHREVILVQIALFTTSLVPRPPSHPRVFARRFDRIKPAAGFNGKAKPWMPALGMGAGLVRKSTTSDGGIHSGL